MTPRKPENPFRFGSLALDESFADRERELAELCEDVRNGQDVVIFAPRRYGKSSLIWRAMRELTADGVLVAYVNLLMIPSKEKFAEQLAVAIYENVSSPLVRARERALAPFRALRITPTVTISDDGSIGFTFGFGHVSEEVDATLERLLELPAELAATRKRRAALVFDEFQEVVELDRRLPRMMRTIFERQPEVARVYLGSKRHMMRRLFSDENEPFWRSAKQVELGLIEPDRFVPFMIERFEASGKHAGENVVGEILGHTHGHPYGTQELAYALWNRTEPGAVAGAAELEQALESVLRSENAHLSTLWENASKVQRGVLAALAAEPGRPLMTEYRTRHGLPSPASVQAALAALVKRELVIRLGGGSYRIGEPFLAEWITRERQTERW